MSKLLTLRLSEADATVIKRLKQATGHKTASRALMAAAAEYPRLKRDDLENARLKREHETMKRDLRRWLFGDDGGGH